MEQIKSYLITWNLNNKVLEFYSTVSITLLHLKAHFEPNIVQGVTETGKVTT